MFRVFFSGLLLVAVRGQSWDSPCPRLFNYESYIDDTWSGILTLKIEKEIFNMNLNVYLDRLPLDFQSDFGRVALENSSNQIAEYSIIEPRYIASNSKIQIRITVKFNPQDPVPFLAGFKFNDRVICPDGGKIKIQQWQKPEITAFEIPRKVSKRIIPEKEETWQSPCPGLFRYEPEAQRNGEWTGVVTVTPQEDLGGIWVRLVFDGVPVNVETDLGTIDLKPTSFPNASEYLIRKTNERLQAGQKRDIKITVTYDETKQVPLLIGFRLNARPVCPDVGIIDPTIFQRPKIWTPTKVARKKNREFISPCPKWFSYRVDPKKLGEWVGVVMIIPEEDLGGVWIRLVLDSEPKNIESNFGLVTQKDSTFQRASEFLIRKTNEKVLKGQKLHLNFTVKYDEADDPPLLVGFRLNARPVCPEDGIIDPERVFTNLEGGASLQKLALVEQMDNRIHMSNQGRNFSSPCPGRFSYEVSKKEGEWIGNIILLPGDGSEWIHMAFKTKPETLVTDFGMVLEKEPTLEGVSEYLIHKTKGGLNVNFTVKYDQKNDPPILLGFRLNDKLVCPEDGIIDPERIQFSGKRQNMDVPMGLRLMDQDLPEVLTEVPDNSSLGKTADEEMLQSLSVTGNEVGGVTESAWQISNWVSPCPERFTYVSSRPGEWIGSVSVNSDEPLDEIVLHLILSSSPKNLQTAFGTVTQNSSEFVIKSGLGFPKGQIQFNFSVSYEKDQQPPLLVSFQQNSRQVCPKSEAVEPTEDPFEVPGTAGTKFPQDFMSPCPRIFSYNFEKVGQWVGMINLITEENFNGIWIRLVLDTKPKTIETNYGLISPKDSSYKQASEFLIKKTNAKLLQGDRLLVNFTVSYDPKSPPPILVGFRLNAKPVCPENGIIDPETTFRRGNMSDSQLGATPDIDNETPGDEDTPEAFTPALGTTGSADEVFTNAEDDEGNLDWGHLFDDFMNLNTPCPHRFLYVFDGEPGKWTGVVSLIAEEDIIGVNLRLLLDSKPKDLESDFGQVTPFKAIEENRAEYLFQDPTQNLSIGDPLNFNFTIDYDLNKPTPRVVAFTLNDKIMCPHNEIIRNSEGQLVTLPNQDFTWSPGVEKTGPEGLDKYFRGEEQKLKGDDIKLEIEGGVKESTCSDVFSPLPLKENNRWYGLITWKPSEELDHMVIDVILDREAQQLGNWFGEVTTLDNIHYKIKKVKPIHIWDVVKVRFFIKYNPILPAPNLKEIRINDKVMCQNSVDTLEYPDTSNGQPMTILENKFPEDDTTNGTLLLQRDYITVWKYDTYTDIKIKNNLPGGKIPIIILR